MMKLLLLVLLMGLAFGACNKSDQSPGKDFAGIYSGTSFRTYSFSTGMDTVGIYPDSVMISTWSDSIRFQGIARIPSGYIISLVSKQDTDLDYHLTVSYVTRHVETCNYVLSKNNDSLKVHYDNATYDPTGLPYSIESVDFYGVRR